jgi:hypothetical protein
MQPDIEKLLSAMPKTRLTTAERLALKQTIINEMHAHPMRERTPWSIFPWTNMRSMKLQLMVAVPVILVLILGGGTSALAERALPGDALYPVKTQVNERVASWLAVSPQSQAQVQTQFAERRLQEAETLAAQSRLNTKTRQELQQDFREHAASAQANLQRFRQDNSSEALTVNSDFEASLKAHERILSNIGAGRDATTSREVDNLVQTLKFEHNSAQNENNHARNELRYATSTFMMNAAQGKRTAAQHKIDEVNNFINRKQDTLGADAVTKTRARLQAATDTLTQGNAMFDAQSYGEAFILFQNAQNIAQEAKLLLNAKIRFDDPKESPAPTPTPTPSITPLSSPTTTPSASSTETWRGETPRNHETQTPETARNQVETSTSHDSEGLRKTIEINLDF